jgi:transposase
MWLLRQPTETLTADERRYVLHLQQHCPDVLVAQALVAEFAAVLAEHDVPGLYAWLHRAEGCGIAEFCTLARGMWLDRSAIEAGVATQWSSGQVEGQVNRLKTLKRAMYGRAKFDLLRQRMLYAG